MSKCKCIDCPNCKLEYINKTYFNIMCDNNGWERRVATYVSDKEVEENTILIPAWCAAKSTQQPKYYINWQEIEPQVDWNDIKVGDIFHIPPYNSNKRQNIKVIGVAPGWFSYSSDLNSSIEFMYPTYAAYKMMVKPKTKIKTTL